MGQPIIKIKLELIDKVMEIIGITALIFLITIPMIFYGELPDEIPSHFDAKGEVDGYSSKASLLMLPVIGLITYLGLLLLNRYPHIFNYPKKITPENAEYYYKIATRFIRLLNIIILSLFAFLTYSSAQIALGNKTGLESSYAFAFVVLIFVSTGIYIFLSYRKSA